MKIAYEDEITQYVNACLAAYTGEKSQLKRCLEIILGLKDHNQDNLLFDQVEPIQLLLGDPRASFQLTPPEVTQAKALIQKLLTAAHDSLVQKKFLAEELVPEDSHLLKLFCRINQRKLSHPIDENDENYHSDSSPPL